MKVHLPASLRESIHVLLQCDGGISIRDITDIKGGYLNSAETLFFYEARGRHCWYEISGETQRRVPNNVHIVRKISARHESDFTKEMSRFTVYSDV